MERTFKRSDAEKLEFLVRAVGKWRVKAGLTVPEVMTALRYEAGKGGFEDCVDEAGWMVRSYFGYKNMIEPEED